MIQPSHPVLITNSSGPRGAKNRDGHRHVVQIFPQNLNFPRLSDKPEVIEDFAWRFLRPERREYFLKRWGSRSVIDDGEELTQEEEPPKERVKWNRMRAPTVLICGHMSRDSRCGLVGPMLKKEFVSQLRQTSKKSPVFHQSKIDERAPSHPLDYTSINLCSHVGGHAFAGNVIIYFPRAFKLVNGGGLSPLAGKSVWYGRVEPRHVEGIVNETMVGGKVIEELLRGVHTFSEYTSLERQSRHDIQRWRGKYSVSW